MLDKKADPNIQDSIGWTALHYAVNSGFLKTVEVLLDSNASPNLKDAQNITVLDIAFQKKDLWDDKPFPQIIEVLEKKGALRGEDAEGAPYACNSIMI